MTWQQKLRETLDLCNDWVPFWVIGDNLRNEVSHEELVSTMRTLVQCGFVSERPYICDDVPVDSEFFLTSRLA